jgi:hypothetical protein
MKTLHKALGQALKSEGVKRTIWISSRLREMRKWTLWMGRPPPKQKQKKRKQPVWEEPVVEAPASPGRMNEGRMNVKRECKTTDQRTLDHASAQVEHHWRKGRMR